MKIRDVTGIRFGRLFVIGKSERYSPAGALWRCVCDCGGETITTSLKLRNGHTTSCGCKRHEPNHVTHGLSKVLRRTYKTWKEMRQRCLNSNNDKWKWYGGRGISIDPEWDSFECFLKDMGERPEGKTLDRINSDGNYSKDNCRWATAKQQAETNRGLFRKGQAPWNYGGLRSWEKAKNVAAK